MRYLAISALFPVLISCFGPDERVLPYPGEITTISDSLQTYQSWFDLETGAVTSVNPAEEWELAFESDPEGWRILVNSGAGWFISNTGFHDFPANVQMPSRLEGLYDPQQLWPDSTATGNWRAHTNTYLLARYDNGSFSAHKQIRFLGYSDSSYIFVFIEQEVTDTVFIIKDKDSNFSYYSFTAKSQVYPEPPKNQYDLLFTSYYELATLFGQTIPYKVGGVLLNSRNTEAAVDSIHRYEEITISSIPLLYLRGQRDIPGYNWKNVVVDISGGGSASYSVRINYNYVIRTAQGNYFKLRFLSYMLDGRSGYPRFEFAALQ